MKYVENQEADAQINEISKHINAGMTDKQISNLFDGKQKNLKVGGMKWNEYDIKEIRETFKLTKEVKEDFLIRFGNGFISFIVGLSAFAVIKFIIIIPYNLMITPDNYESMKGVQGVFLILSIFLAYQYTKKINGSGTKISRSVIRIITTLVGIPCLFLSAAFLNAL